eukprot:m.909037 g.909037  ORF g.909037 m.909037 type:complete len:135 (-) comp23719_c0_seq1:763-1167(-)
MHVHTPLCVNVECGCQCACIWCAKHCIHACVVLYSTFSSPGDVIATSVLAILTAPLRWLRMTLGLAASPSYTHKRLCLRFLNCAFAPRVQVLASALAGQRRDLPAHFLQMCFWADEPHSDLAVLAADVCRTSSS